MKLVLALIVCGGIVGAVAWWEHGAFDRLVQRGSRESLSDSDWTLLTEHIDDPKVLGPVSYELHSASAGPTCKDSFRRADDHVGTILARQKTSDDVSLQAIANMMTRCNEPKLLAWTSRPAADLVKTIHDREIATLHFAPPNVLTDMLFRLKPKVDQNLVDVVLASTKPHPSSVDTFFINGFPPDGSDFISGGPTVAPATDPRQTHGIAQWLWSLQEPGAFGIQPEAATAMLRILDHVTPPKLDDKIARCIGLANGGEPEAIKLCQRLATPADKDLITKAIPNPSDQAGCLRALDAADDAKRILSGDGAQAEKVAALIELGPKTVPVLRDAVMSKDPAVRMVAERAFAIVDRHLFSRAVAKSLRAGVATIVDGGLIRTSLEDPPVEVDAWLALLALNDDATTKAAIAFLHLKSKPDDWVPELFAALGSEPRPSDLEVAGDRRLLKQTDGVASLVGAMLAHALANAGTPENVDGATKVLALEVLAAQGTAKNAPAIEPFVGDTSAYANKPIGPLATEALAAVKAR